MSDIVFLNKQSKFLPDGLFDWELELANTLVSWLNLTNGIRLDSPTQSRLIDEKLVSCLSLLFGSSLLEWARGLVWYVQDGTRCDMLVSSLSRTRNENDDISDLELFLDNFHSKIHSHLFPVISLCSSIDTLHLYLSSSTSNQAHNVSKKKIYNSLLQILFLTSQPRILEFAISSSPTSSSSSMKQGDMSNLFTAFTSISSEIDCLISARENPSSLPSNSLAAELHHAMSGKHSEVKWKSLIFLHDRFPTLLEVLRTKGSSTHSLEREQIQPVPQVKTQDVEDTEIMKLVLQAESELAQTGVISSSTQSQLRRFLQSDKKGLRSSLDSLLDLLTPPT